MKGGISSNKTIAVVSTILEEVFLKGRWIWRFKEVPGRECGGLVEARAFFFSGRWLIGVTNRNVSSRWGRSEARGWRGTSLHT